MPEHHVEMPLGILLSAFRYALGRSSYVVGEVIEQIREHMDELRACGWHDVIAEEIDARGMHDLGMAMDRDAWLILRAELKPSYD